MDRYGTTTCEVAKMQNNSGNLISVEPDFTVWAVAEVRSCYSMYSWYITQCVHFQFNKLSHNCAGWSVYGAIGDEDLYFSQPGDDQPKDVNGVHNKMYNRKPSSDR